MLHQFKNNCTLIIVINELQLRLHLKNFPKSCSLNGVISLERNLNKSRPNCSPSFSRIEIVVIYFSRHERKNATVKNKKNCQFSATDMYVDLIYLMFLIVSLQRQFFKRNIKLDDNIFVVVVISKYLLNNFSSKNSAVKSQFYFTVRLPPQA